MTKREPAHAADFAMLASAIQDLQRVVHRLEVLCDERLRPLVRNIHPTPRTAELAQHFKNEAKA